MPTTQPPNIYQRIAALQARERELLTAPIKPYQDTLAGKRLMNAYVRQVRETTGPLGWTPPGKVAK